MLDTGTGRSRRSVLAASVGALAGAVAHALGRPSTAQAAVGDVIHVGDRLTAEVLTELRNEVNTETVFRVTTVIGTALRGLADQGTAVSGTSLSGAGVHATSSTGPAVLARSTAGHGVSGESSDGTGVSGFSGQAVGMFAYSLSATEPALVANSGSDRTGVFGYSGILASPTSPAKTGVYGLATQDASATGIHGRSTTGTGVHAQADPTGTALKVSGKATFSRSGVLTIAAGKGSVTKSLAGLTTSSLVFAVVRTGGSGVWVRKVAPRAGGFTVYLNKTAGRTATVAWIAFG